MSTQLCELLPFSPSFFTSFAGFWYPAKKTFVFQGHRYPLTPIGVGSIYLQMFTVFLQYFLLYLLYFQLHTVSPLLSGSTLPPPPLPCVNKYTVYTYTVCSGEGVYGVLELRQINTCRKVPLQVNFCMTTFCIAFYESYQRRMADRCSIRSLRFKLLHMNLIIALAISQFICMSTLIRLYNGL